MKKIILIVIFFMASLNAFGGIKLPSFNCKKPVKKYWFIEIKKGVDWVFESGDPIPVNIAIIDYQNNIISTLDGLAEIDKEVKMKGKSHKEKRESLRKEIDKIWPKHYRMKYY